MAGSDHDGMGSKREKSDAEKRQRVASLSRSEFQVYQWTREGFSRGWIAETMLCSRARIKGLERQICKKLSVDNRHGIVRFYAVLDNDIPAPDITGDPPEPFDTFRHAPPY